MEKLKQHAVLVGAAIVLGALFTILLSGADVDAKKEDLESDYANLSSQREAIQTKIGLLEQSLKADIESIEAEYEPKFAEVTADLKQTDLDLCLIRKDLAWEKVVTSAKSLSVAELTRLYELSMMSCVQEEVDEGDKIVQDFEVVPEEKPVPENMEPLGNWKITTYYTPVPDQTRYFYNNYAEDFSINCSGDCFTTASGYKLTDYEAGRIAACPPNFAFDTKLFIEGAGTVVCKDRGGAIKGKRIDIWVGSGDYGLNNVGKGSSKSTPVYLIK